MDKHKGMTSLVFLGVYWLKLYRSLQYYNNPVYTSELGFFCSC